MMKNLVFAGCALLVLSASARADSLPNTMLGHWCAVGENSHLFVRKACPDEPEWGLIVRQNEYVVWETRCEIKKVQRKANGAYLVNSSCDSILGTGPDDTGEGTYWTEESEFKITGKRLSIRVVSSTDPISKTTLLRSIAMSRWCTAGGRTYALEYVGDSIIWTDNLGNINREAVISDTETDALTRTESSQHVTSKNVRTGQIWSYVRISPSRVMVTPEGKDRFFINRCS